MRSSATSPGLPRARAQPLQALRDQDAVVGVERHDVSDRAERDEVGDGAEIRLGLAGEAPARRSSRAAPASRRTSRRRRRALSRKGAAGWFGLTMHRLAAARRPADGDR
jgi:hypothetical protein